jgi:hypothetical protein
MPGKKRLEVPAELAAARDRLRSWRHRRKPGTRIPRRLWGLAVRLAGVYGVSRTASTLSLDYYALKERVAAVDESESSTADCAFIELPATVSAGRECVIEYEDGAGTSVRFHLKGYDAADVMAVGRSLRDDV